MAHRAKLLDPRTAGAPLDHLRETIEQARRAASAALDANEPPGAERIPEQDEYTPTSGGDFPAGMSQSLGRAAERMRRGPAAKQSDDEPD